MTKSHVIATLGFGVGAQSVLTFFALIYEKPGFLVWCAAFLVYHSIVLRRLLREGVSV